MLAKMMEIQTIKKRPLNNQRGFRKVLFSSHQTIPFRHVNSTEENYIKKSTREGVYKFLRKWGYYICKVEGWSEDKFVRRGIWFYKKK
jgi:hypothetical protein